MAYPTVVMVSALSRELSPFNPTWSVPQLQEHLARALSGTGPALSTEAIPEKSVAPKIALVVRTSGSTGNPKSVALTATALLANARATHRFLGAQPGDRWSLLLPVHHIAGINILIRAIELGTLPVGVQDSADFTAIVPTQLFRALHGDQTLLTHLQNCKKVLVGGGALSASLRNEGLAAGIHIVESYGMTETCGGVIYDGMPLEGVEMKIDKGRIALKGNQIDPQYLGGEISLLDGWFTSSDLGEIHNNRLTVVGRSDDQIISGGEKISLSAIEEFLREIHPDSEFVAFAQDDKEWGQRLCVATTGRLASERIVADVKQRFGHHAAPKEVRTVQEIPYLSIGKPDRRKLAHDFS